MNTSYWLDQTRGKQYPPLSTDKHIHTLIIGAGLTGLSTAYYLSTITTNVMVIEADEIGYGASGRNTGKVTVQHGMIYKKLMQLHGQDSAKQYYQMQKEAIDSIAAIIQEHGISCSWQRQPAILYTQDKTKIAQLQDEYQACLDLTIPCHYLETTDLAIPFVAGIQFDEQGSYDPYRYLLGLSDILDAAGISIYEHSPASSIEKEGSGWLVHVQDHVIHAQNIVSATQLPILDAFSFFYAKTYPSVSHLALIAHEHADKMYYSIDNPMLSYHGFDSHLLCGGYAHECAKMDEQDYEAWLAEIQRTWDCAKPKWVWNSQDLVSYDHLPFIGPLSQKHPNFFIACGYSKWGNTNANVAGKIISAMILKQDYDNASLFSPERKRTFLQPKCFQMNIKTAFSFIKSWFPTFHDQDCAIHEGKTIELGGHPYGMFRDEHDELYIVDLVCPHLGCICTFNKVDQTWDCPCHGSRFSYRGDIIKGPAHAPLTPYQEGNNHVDPREMLKHHD